MTPVPVIFEDHTLAGFRPLAWSLPVCELRCGLLNLRERLTHVAGREPVLLVRSLLAELASSGGYQVGADAVKPEQGIVLLSGRLGARWDLLSDLCNLIHLLLVTAENDTDLQVIENVPDFLGKAGLIYGG